MAADFESFRCRDGFSSPPCLAGEIAPDYFDPLGVNPQQARDVARWRKAERARLRAERALLSTGTRRNISASIMAGVLDILGDRHSERHEAIALYWPIKDEPDLRPLMTAIHGDGQRVALPVVEQNATPLVFREWTPETRMDRGVWNIPVPPRTARPVQPDIVLAPLLGWDGEGYRLGYGGGYFDRTLAALTPRPFCIGIGLAAARLSTIFPQPHDIPFDVILTEHGVEFERKPEHGQRTDRARTP